MTFIIVVLICLVIWLTWITIFLLRLKRNYLILTHGINRKTIDVVLSSISKDINKSKEDIAKLAARCDTIEREEQLHIQKIGLLRFNPFKDTGGDQSFILALVDAFNTGVIITALYSRSGTRWYTKKIFKGRGTEHELSEEEKKALQMAEGIK